jgi:hypothetical protein
MYKVELRPRGGDRAGRVEYHLVRLVSRNRLWSDAVCWAGVGTAKRWLRRGRWDVDVPSTAIGVE